MKHLSLLAAAFLLFMTTGCGAVVYRVNTASPPQMTVAEAMEAVELSLSMRLPDHNFSKIMVRDDSIEMIRDIPNAHTSSMKTLIFGSVNYGAVNPEVRKLSNDFIVSLPAYFAAVEYLSVAWKSEDDAKMFVNAVYVLANREKFGRSKTKEWAQVSGKSTLPTLPVTDNKTENKDTAAKSNSDDKKDKPSSLESAIFDKTPPQITITSPDITRAVSLEARKSGLTIIGKVYSDSGVADVFVNGQQADLDEKGNFSAEILLKVGQNQINVTAIDVYKNRSTKQFTVERASVKTGAVKVNAPIAAPKTGLRAAKYYALLIAVQDYKNPNINRLDYPISDAKRLMDILITKYTFERENIVFLQNPDRRLIYKSFQELRKRLTDNDNLLIFYAGHGVWMEDMKQGFWLPRDAAGPNDPSDWIPNSNIRDYVKAIKAKHVLLVADACFSGGIFKVRSAFSEQDISLEKIYEMPSRKAITSGALKTVPDRSVFVDFLVKRLSDNRDSFIDTQKLFSSMRDAVINNSPTQQTPLYGAINEAGDEGGDFVFVRK